MLRLPSSGAIAGALYASGYTGKQIDSLMRALPMDQVIARYEPQVSTTIGLLRPTAVWDLTAAGYALQSGAAHEGELNALMSALFLRGNVIARGNFDRLPIPFRAIATDLRTHAPVVLGTGDLARAIRASSAIPVILRPMQVDGRWLTDGGIAENEPVKSARALGAQRVWVSRLPYAPPSPSSYEDPLQIMANMLNSLFEQDSLVARPGDVVVIAGKGPNSSAIVATIAAPVGVVNSATTGLVASGMPRSSSAVAGTFSTRFSKFF